MKLQIGEHAYIWHDNGNGIYDGIKGEIIGWARREDGNWYRFDNLGSDLPRWIPEHVLISVREYQLLTSRLLAGDLKNTKVGRWLRNPDNWYIHPERRQYAKKAQS